MGQDGGVVLRTVSSQQEGLGVKSPIWRGLFLYGFYMFCMGSCQVLGFLPQASNIKLAGFG